MTLLEQIDERLAVVFLSKVNKKAPNGCWEWTGHRVPKGYGRMFLDRKQFAVHRWSYEHFVAPIPKGLFVCHRCDNPPCCNPAHLFVGTAGDNKRDAIGKYRHARREKHGRSKLSEADILEITRLYVPRTYSGPGSSRELAKRFGVDITTISRAATGRLWKPGPKALAQITKLMGEGK